MLTQRSRPIDPSDIAPSTAFRAAAAPRKGVILGTGARPMFDAMRGATPLADGVRIEPGKVGGVGGLWCRVGATPTRARLLFLHGGGYMMGTAASTANFASQLAIRSGADTFVADYRLAPEHPFPAAFEDAVAAYRGLTDEDGPIAITGESAGGGLALAVLATLTGSSEWRVPVAAAVMSPWTDLTLSGASFRTRADADPIFTRAALSALVDTYLQGQNAADPRASPLLGVMPSLPIRIDVGEDEVLLDDALAYASRAAEVGAAVTVAVWQGMPHVFQARLNGLVTAMHSFGEAGAFLTTYLNDQHEK